MQTTIFSTYIQEVSTIHPDLIIQVPFKYKAVVHDDEGETVEVRNVCVPDNGDEKQLSINENVPSVNRFLACIREDARKKVYEKREKSQYIQQAGPGQRTAKTTSNEQQ